MNEDEETMAVLPKNLYIVLETILSEFNEMGIGVVDEQFITDEVERWKKVFCGQYENGMYHFTDNDLLEFLEQSRLKLIDKSIDELWLNDEIEMRVNTDGEILYKLTPKGEQRAREMGIPIDEIKKRKEQSEQEDNEIGGIQ